MYKGTIPVIFIIYFALFFIAYSPIKEGKLPIFDFSLFFMILIFWASFFILKKNLFNPLLKVLKEREEFVRKREEKYEEALRILKEAEEDFESQCQHLREKERQALAEYSRKLKEKQMQEIENFKKELQEKLKITLKSVEKQKKETMALIDKNVPKYAENLARRILKKDVA